jgi:site-specific DNA-methyltransferase (adenine-specific)
MNGEKTRHILVNGDARDLGFIPDGSIHLVVTSPPYWILKRYRDHPGQMGHIEDYDTFVGDLSRVWRHCYRILVPGGRLVCVVGDVCLSRRRHGRHVVVPLHADIAVSCKRIGFDNLNPIIWYKIAKATYEVDNGSKFFGKPYEPNAIIKNDIEFILMQRKPGGYRKPTMEQRQRSMIDKKDYETWFQQIWDIPGASTSRHPAPFPLELAFRLVRMFSFWGDTVLDPFCGTGTTMLAALKTGRNSIGVEVDPEYCQSAVSRLHGEGKTLFSNADIDFAEAEAAQGALAGWPRGVMPLYDLTPASGRVCTRRRPWKKRAAAEVSEIEAAE